MNNFQQPQLAVLSDVKRIPEILTERQEDLLDEIGTHSQAILFSIQYARRTQTAVGEEMGIKKSHWSGICNGTKNMSFAAWRSFREVVANDIYLQWLAWTAGYRLVRREPSKQKQLEMEVKELREKLEAAEKASNNQ